MDTTNEIIESLRRWAQDAMDGEDVCLDADTLEVVADRLEELSRAVE